MKFRPLTTLLVAALLSACAPLLAGLLDSTPAPQAVQTASAPLANTRVDESGFRALLEAADATRHSINALVAAGAIVRNSPKALAIRHGVLALHDALAAGQALLDALNNPVITLSPADFVAKLDQYRSAMRNATDAAREITDALSGAN